MIVRVSDDNDYATYYCTLCCRPFKPLQEANEHAKFCGQAAPTQPVFRSYTTAATFEEDDDTQFYMNEARTWQGLTDEEYQQILIQHDGAGLLAFYNLVETKLKEKNT
jgi:ribosome-binding factor A